MRDAVMLVRQPAATSRRAARSSCAHAFSHVSPTTICHARPMPPMRLCAACSPHDTSRRSFSAAHHAPKVQTIFAIATVG
jgi:hypothetical protein